MLTPLFADHFPVQIKHRKARIGTTVEIYRMSEQDQFVIDISDSLKLAKGNKKEPVRKPYAGMYLIFPLKKGNRKLVVSYVDMEHREATLTENGEIVPCKMFFN